MVNAPFSFICGLIWIAVTIEMADQGINTVAVVAVFIFALFWLIPVTLMQMPDDSHIVGAAFRRKRQ